MYSVHKLAELVSCIHTAVYQYLILGIAQSTLYFTSFILLDNRTSKDKALLGHQKYTSPANVKTTNIYVETILI